MNLGVSIFNEMEGNFRIELQLPAYSYVKRRTGVTCDKVRESSFEFNLQFSIDLQCK